MHRRLTPFGSLRGNRRRFFAKMAFDEQRRSDNAKRALDDALRMRLQMGHDPKESGYQTRSD